MAKTIRKIPATLNQFNSEPVAAVRKRKVAGYARVSTDREEQATSYEAQMSYYKNYIEGRTDWEFVGMYSDEGISATNTKKREGFNKMIKDALKGKIDLIITKSVSRFARNTVDSLSTIRKLKENGIEVYFEKENIWTLDAKGELMITIMSSLAQEESRSISENTTWGKRKQFADGKADLAFSRFLGYDKGFKINEEEAKTVRLIYKLYIEGYSFNGVAKELERRKLKAPAGGDKWHSTTIRSILSNEKYRGDALLQKQYTTDFLQKTRKKNNGEIPQYYVEDHHEAIIPPEQFDFVQLEMLSRDKTGRYGSIDLYSYKIQCGECGGWYAPKVWHSNDKYRRIIYRCNKKYEKGKKRCSTPHFTEEEIQDFFLKAVNKLIKSKDEIMCNLQMLIDSTCDTSSLMEEKEKLEQELNVMAEHMRNLIQENAHIPQDQDEYIKKEETIRKIYEEKHSRYEELEEQIEEKKHKRQMMINFTEQLHGMNGEITKFREELWRGLLDYMRVDSKNQLTFIFRGDVEIRICI